MSQRLSSSLAACVWIPLSPLRCEEARQDSLAAHPTALLAPDTTKKLWQVSPLARHAGVKPGMTVSQAIGLCPTLQLVEPDPVHYDEQFAALLAALGEVSPVIEPGGVGLGVFRPQSQNSCTPSVAARHTPRVGGGESENSPLGSRPAATQAVNF